LATSGCHYFSTDSQINYGLTHYKIGAYNQAIPALMSAAKSLEKKSPPDPRLVEVLIALGEMVQIKEGNDLAADFYLRALNAAEALQPADKGRLRNALVHLGVFYCNHERAQDAIPLLERATAISTTLDDQEFQAIDLDNLAYAYQNLRQYEIAVELQLKALTVANQLPVEKFSTRTIILLNIGNSYKELGRYKEAENSFKESIAALTSKGREAEPRLVKTAKKSYADLLRRMSRGEEADKLGKSALQQGAPYEAPRAPTEPRAAGAEPAGLAENLERHIRVLAEEICPRHVRWPKELERSARYIEDELSRLGYSVVSQPYDVHGTTVRNLVAEQAGASTDVVVVGAHYDTVWSTCGANDNASGVAALLELARLLRGRPLGRTVRFVGFVNREEPFFKTPLMGSRVYARSCRERGDRIWAMISLDTIGRYSDKPDKKRDFETPLFFFHYPSTGNFLWFVSNRSNRTLAAQAMERYRAASSLPADQVALAAWFFTFVDNSDHWSFWEEGYPAMLITDTATRYPWRHYWLDTPDHIDFNRFAQVTVGLAEVVAELTGQAPPRGVD